MWRMKRQKSQLINFGCHLLRRRVYFLVFLHLTYLPADLVTYRPLDLPTYLKVVYLLPLHTEHAACLNISKCPAPIKHYFRYIYRYKYGLWIEWHLSIITKEWNVHVDEPPKSLYQEYVHTWIKPLQTETLKMRKTIIWDILVIQSQFIIVCLIVYVIIDD